MQPLLQARSGLQVLVNLINQHLSDRAVFGRFGSINGFGIGMLQRALGIDLDPVKVVGR